VLVVAGVGSTQAPPAAGRGFRCSNARRSGRVLSYTSVLPATHSHLECLALHPAMASADWRASLPFAARLATVTKMQVISLHRRGGRRSLHGMPHESFHRMQSSRASVTFADADPEIWA
jgi:hypothetical protein